LRWPEVVDVADIVDEEDATDEVEICRVVDMVE
jgi:hypothetical protein